MLIVHEMNTLRDIRDKLKIVNKDLSTTLNIHPNSINTMLDRELDNFTLKQIIALKNLTRLSYNELLGEKIFDDSTQLLTRKEAKELIMNILDNIKAND